MPNAIDALSVRVRQLKSEVIVLSWAMSFQSVRKELQAVQQTLNNALDDLYNVRAAMLKTQKVE